MHLIYTVFIALANNIDNISVRIAYSIKGVKITAMKNLWISVITFIIASFAAFFGTFISRYFNKNISGILSMVILTAIGLWLILEQYIKKENNNEIESENSGSGNIYEVLRKPETADVDNSKDIDFKEATLLGIALSIDNIGGGFSAGMIGLNAFFIGFFSAFISFLAIWSGNYIANFFNRWKMGKKATTAAGIVLIIIGLKQVIH